MRVMSSQNSIEAEFTKIDRSLDENLTVYLMGGGAMTLRGLKNATYDLDLLLTTRYDFEYLRDLLIELDYEIVENPIDEYKELGAAVLLDKNDACRFDIFDRKVVKKLSLSEDMKRRAKEVFTGSKLRVKALKNVDIFLFKGVAGRTRDVTDMINLVETEKGLDFNVILEEFKNQIPMNKGKVERDVLRDSPEDHPVIAFERALESLPMTLPRPFMKEIEKEADWIYAEFGIMSDIEGKTTIEKLADTLITKNSLDISTVDEVNNIVEGLVDKGILELDDGKIKFREF